MIPLAGSAFGGPGAVQLSGFLPGSHHDAFGRLRTAHPQTIFDSKQRYDKQPLFWDEETINGTAVHQSSDAATLFTVAANNGDIVVRQTKMRFQYQPGKSQQILMTGVMEPETDTTKRLGPLLSETTTPFAPDEGICFESVGTTMNVTIFKGGSATEQVAQAAWDDPLDGTGASGVTIDWSAPQIFYFDFEWLGVGSVRFGVMVDGVIHIVHSLHHANDPTFTTTYMEDCNLPLHYELRSTGGAGTLLQICSVVNSEGGSQNTGITRSVDMQQTPITGIGAGTRQALFAIRLKSTHLATFIQHVDISGLAATGDDIRWFLSIDPTVADFTPGGETWTSVPNSGVEFFRMDGANTIASEANEGTRLWSGYTSGNTRQISFSSTGFIRPGVAIDGTAEVWVVSAQSLGAGGQAAAAMTYQERE